MIHIEDELIAIFKKLHDKSGSQIVVDNKDALVIEILSLIKDYIKQREEVTYKGIKGIGDKIKETRIEITSQMQNGAANGAVAEAAVELDAVIESTEDATNKILDTAEHLQELLKDCKDAALTEKISTDISAIFEACNFQDLTGQRIKKVMSTLKYIENSVGGMLESFSDPSVEVNIANDKRPDADLMNGPQLKGDAPSQSDVDKLFDSA